MSSGVGGVQPFRIPRAAYGGEERHPVIDASLEYVLTRIFVFFEFPVETALVAAIRDVGDFHKGGQPAAKQFPLASQPDVNTCKTGVPAGVSHPWHCNKLRFAFVIDAAFEQ